MSTLRVSPGGLGIGWVGVVRAELCKGNAIGVRTPLPCQGEGGVVTPRVAPVQPARLSWCPGPPSLPPEHTLQTSAQQLLGVAPLEFPAADRNQFAFLLPSAHIWEHSQIGLVEPVG